MVYVKFTGKTPFPDSDYEEYFIFYEEDLTEEELKANIRKQNIDFAIENARMFDSNLDLRNKETANETYLDYLQNCVEEAHFLIITEAEFNDWLDAP